MESSRKKNLDGNDVEESWGPPQPSYSSYSPLPTTSLPTNLPIRNPSDQDQMQSSYALYQANIPQTPYGASDSNSYPYPGATPQSGNLTHYTPSPLVEPRTNWHNRQYSQGGHTSYTPRDGSDITMGHDLYAYGTPFPTPVLNSQEMPVREAWTSDEDLVESRRPTITQEIQYVTTPTYAGDANEDLNRPVVSHRDELNREASSSLPLDMAAGPSSYHYRSKESPNDPFSGHRTHQNHRIDEHRSSNIRTNRQNQGPYQQVSRRGLGRPTSLTHPAELAHSRHGSSGYGEGSSFASEVPGAIAIPQAPMIMDNIRQFNPPGGHIYPLRDGSPFSRSLPSRSPRYDWSTERSSSSAATPAPTEGSADPAQSDQDEYEPRASASTSPSTSTSTSASSTASRWARFRVPADVFTNPFDPVRHQMYHQIRHEEWFLNQAQERPITAGEAARIPGSIPGESVLLAFYDRVTDVNGKTVLRCTICMNTNPDAQLYPRPDRAKVHMRHHFELRPIPCNGKCDIPNCAQRFFTMGDLGAHVAGKTEPLATCDYCRKTMRSKNLKRHVANFCHRAPENLRGKRRP